MAVYKRDYRAYTGPADAALVALPGPAALRPGGGLVVEDHLIVPVHAGAAAASDRVADRSSTCANNPVARDARPARGKCSRRLPINARVLPACCWRSRAGSRFVLTAWIGPRADLVRTCATTRCRSTCCAVPFSRTEYVLGKIRGAGRIALGGHLGSGPAAVLLPGLSSPARLDGREHADRLGDLRRALVWIVVLSLLALALSAWVKWRVGGRRHHHRCCLRACRLRRRSSRGCCARAGASC